MAVEQIRNLCRAQPFRPFTLHLADGRHLDVHHPDFMAFAPSGRTVVVYQSDDVSNIVDVMLVTDLEVKTNGSRKKR